jgi:dTDP-4-dehydrorhamnose reductase
MIKILILGASGMAGHVVYQYLSEKKEYEMYNAVYRNKYTDDSFILDIRNEYDVLATIKSIRPDIIINCVGVLIQGAKNNPENAIYINAYFPHMLSRLLHQEVPNSKLIHISTDCVFSGKKGRYLDTDEKDALDLYGMSKNLGEVLNAYDLTIRTSIIGPELKNFGEGLFHWTFNQQLKGHINGFTKSIWGGVTTLELARLIDLCICNDVCGLYQASNNQPIRKYDLVNLIVKEFNLQISVTPVDGVICDKSILNTQNSKVSYEVPSYAIMMSEIHTFMVQHKRTYIQYLGG